MSALSDYSVPREAEAVFRRQILRNPLMQDLPGELHELGRLVRFRGNALPGIPVNWRWAESISALKAFEATMLNHLLSCKYGVSPVEVTINTDHASLFVLSPALARIVDETGPASSTGGISPDTLKPFRSEEERHSAESLHRIMATNIYKTRDGRFYHVHGSLNPDTTLAALGLPPEGGPDDTLEDVVERFQSRVSQLDAAALDELINEQHRQAGTIAWSADEYCASEHGKANADVGLYELVPDPDSHQPAAWWPDHSSLPSSPQRPLAGLKVVDLTRVIAGPTITRSLAELGASVMRVTSPHLPDFTSAHRDLNWGKWNCSLHLRDEADRLRLRQLIAEADVVVDGYRPGALERLGFGRRAVFDLVRGRHRGIVHLGENCYGWHGPWAHRSGWQGISDAACGVSLAYGRAMGVDEAVTPPFPNSDHCTGVIGCTAILHALVQRAEKGGSYGVNVSLNYYSQWLVHSCGTYDDNVWAHLWRRHGSPAFRHYHNTRRTGPALLQLLHQHDGQQDGLFNPAFFGRYRSEAVGVTVDRLRPLAQFRDQLVQLRYNVGTRGNGVDEPVWPDDLTVEIVI
ncbi:coA-transferase family III domain-containing protein [Hirsutella rhossiliensis]|uniref:CoA-transferase family III domain-containing protein n=1 Tax=Hirsutella rhossiliensis TaxID=111463 RepID=A0A9P8SF19_9HYPO|nr:coA-transferase family III domain-containing protein [Hirsutella rhossiliensis]KAH0959614.1 coA-transferase family III domain-containing protein [Hirsutella rhossiliensis]